MISQRLKELRKEKGITQKQFSEIFQVASGTIAMWEIGKRQPDIQMIDRIASYFEVSVDYLLGKTDIKKSPSDKPEVTDDDIQFALFGGKVDDETYEDVKRFAAFIKAKKEEQKKEKE